MVSTGPSRKNDRQGLFQQDGMLDEWVPGPLVSGGSG